MDRNGIPPPVRVTVAVVHDSTIFEDSLESIELIRRSNPDRLPFGAARSTSSLHSSADAAGRISGGGASLSRTVYMGIETSTTFGPHRWVVDRTIECINRWRRVIIRFERNADLRLACLDLGYVPISFTSMQTVSHWAFRAVLGSPPLDCRFGLCDASFWLP